MDKKLALNENRQEILNIFKSDVIYAFFLVMLASGTAAFLIILPMYIQICVV